MMKKDLFIYGAIIVLWSGYLLLTVLQPNTPNPLTGSLSTFQVMLLRLSIALPYLFIWLVAFYGGLALRTYTAALADLDERHALRRVATGIFILAAGLLITTFLSSTRQLLQVRESDLVPMITILINYAYILIPLVSFSYFFTGAQGMAHKVRADGLSFGETLTPLAGALMVSGTYAWLVFTNPNREMALNASTPATYSLSDPIIIATIIIPFFLSLLLGFLSLAHFTRYLKNVTGIVYKAATARFITGIFLVILGGIILQILLSLGSRLLGFGLGTILGIIYLFLAVQAGGYIFIALGSKKLTAVEQILKKYQFTNN